ncbi:MAG: hypothetical protein M3R38_23345 [Actinomycetota bacterium]|nr:hypothetical protein [Actinomycetota bacterium]
MDTTSVQNRTTRLQRGIALHRERGAEIERISAHTYRVPSGTGEGFYTAYTDLRACTCPDHKRAKAAGERCKHVHAAEIVLAKRRAARRRQRDAS